MKVLRNIGNYVSTNSKLMFIKLPLAFQKEKTLDPPQSYTVENRFRINRAPSLVMLVTCVLCSVFLAEDGRTDQRDQWMFSVYRKGFISLS